MNIMGVSLLNLQSRATINMSGQTPLIIGRGDVPGCSDKRVSRKHGELAYRPDGKLQIMALHTNPCFFMENGLPPVVILKKDESQVLNDGDLIALLPDSFWYQIVITNDNSATANEESSSSIKKDLSPKKVTPVKVQCQNISPQPETSCSKADPAENTDSKPKRLLPVWMYEIDGTDDKKAKSNKRPLSGTSKDANTKKQKASDEAEIEENSQMKPLVDDKEEESAIFKRGVTPEIEINNIPSSLHQLSDEEPDNVSVKSNESNRTPVKLPEVKTNSVSNTPVKSEGEGSKEKSGYESDVVEPDPPAAQPMFPLRKRPLCQYEGNCYRKNMQHKQEYSHPGDADFIPPEGRPMCPYGAACYRQNVMHRVEYQHPTGGPAPPPQPSPSQQSSPPGEDRPRCQYGMHCYRQNPQHRREYYHPTQSHSGSSCPPCCSCGFFGLSFPYFLLVLPEKLKSSDCCETTEVKTELDLSDEDKDESKDDK